MNPFLAALLLLGCVPVQAAFLVKSESTIVDLGSDTVTFTIDFSRPPDFYTLDGTGRPATSFQYFVIDASGIFGAYNHFDTIIRGDEIHIANAVRVRNAGPPSPDPGSGGWGDVRGAVPFQLSGAVLTFSAPLELVSDAAPGAGGHFSYELQTYEFGGASDTLRDQSQVVVPEGGAFPMIAAGLLAFSLWRRV